MGLSIRELRAACEIGATVHWVAPTIDLRIHFGTAPIPCRLRRLHDGTILATAVGHDCLTIRATTDGDAGNFR